MLSKTATQKIYAGVVKTNGLNVGRKYCRMLLGSILQNFFFFFFFFFFIFTLYSPRHLTYRGSVRAIPLHALQTTVKVLYWLIVSLAHPFHALFMQFQN